MPIIQTAAKVVDKFGAGRHGFTSGNAQAGVSPTQISFDWCDGVQEEINNVIVYGEQTIDSDGPYTGMREALKKRIRDVREGNLSTPVTRRTPQLPDQPTWLERKLTVSHQYVSKNAVYGCSLALPNNSIATFEFTIQCVDRDSPSTYACFVLVGSCRQIAGTCTVNSYSAVHSAVNFDASALAIGSSSSITGQLFIENTAPAHSYNVFITGIVRNVDIT